MPASARAKEPLIETLPLRNVSSNDKRPLEAGVTAVRDLGVSEYMDIAMRNLINRGAMQRTRMFVSGWGPARTAFRPPDPPPAGGGIADSPEE